MPRNWSWGKKREDGYRSKKESELAEWLTKSGMNFTYESMKLSYTRNVRKAECKACGSRSVVTIRQYTPDFILSNGNIIEYKGRLTTQDRAKLIAVKEANPKIKLKLLFGSDNKIRKNSDKRYSDWAAEYGFDYAIGVPPKRWLRSVQ